MTSPPDDTTTDTSAIIAALRTERDAAVAREAALAGNSPRTPLHWRNATANMANASNSRLRR